MGSKEKHTTRYNRAVAFIQSLENKKTRIKTHFATEKVLAKDWNKQEEEKAWQDL